MGEGREGRDAEGGREGLMVAVFQGGDVGACTCIWLG